jgi:hypothetical protein
MLYTGILMGERERKRRLSDIDERIILKKKLKEYGVRPQNVCLMRHLTQLTDREDLITWYEVKVKLSLCLTKHHAMKAYWGLEV